ncbi:MAG TPA: hypothetical protein PKJ99_09330 [Thermoanaerobaculales bacterium]|nr:hypothetical protein [Thermoanaerobaculales bacterium]HPA81544.1 hypothetical protein [Thermoanaerobaculales bacterium]HQL30756.1 hypothetical protein [Thermoanaerobaculales bacterium]HQP44589.1 hypothetical protein [Thermoanaerobaculales bacterium]
MELNASKVRETISKVLSRFLKAGKVPESLRKTRTEGVVALQVSSKLSRLVPRDYLRCDPESIVHLDWSGEAIWIE